MKQSFEAFLFDKLNVNPKSKLLLAVSGGMDSMCLWELCRQLKLDFIVAHCNFKLRKEASDLDEAFVKDHALDNEKVYSKSFDTKAFAKEQSLSIQMAARELRYTWFEELKEEHACDFVVTAHHLDDQVETFFIQLLRKSNLPALAGMPVRTSKLIRPLMFASKESIEHYVEKNKVPYRDDESNDTDAYLRNRIRRNLVPALQKVLPDFKVSVLELMTNMKEFTGALSDYFEKKEGELVKHNDQGTIVNIEALKGIDFPILFLEHYLRKLGFTKSVAQNLYDILDGPSGKVFFSKTHRIIKDRENIVILPLELSASDEITMDKEKLCDASEFFIKASIQPNEKVLLENRVEGMALLDFDQLHNKITFRKWRAGDYFYPLGMGGRKKISDYFIDKKYSLKDKESQWIMTSGGEICWIVGRNIDDRFKIRDNTKVVLILEQH